MAPLKKWKSCEHTHDLINTNHTMSHTEVVPLPFAQAKNGDKQFGNKSSCSQWEGSACTHAGSSFFLLGEGTEGFFFVFSLFPMCYYHVPIEFQFLSGSQSSQLVTQDVPNSTSELFHMVCPKFNSDVCELTRWAIWTTFVSVLWLGPKEVLQLGSAQCCEKIDHVWILQKTKKTVVSAPNVSQF
jgi:hypothetical protein